MESGRREIMFRVVATTLALLAAVSLAVEQARAAIVLFDNGAINGTLGGAAD